MTNKNQNCSVEASAGMRSEEYVVLRKLLTEHMPKLTLEVGMANGGSSLEVCRLLREVGGTRHTVIDPFQSHEGGWGGRGIKLVQDGGFGDLLEMIEDYDYLALPKLVAEKRQFDFILIDGWHSFDYTFIDLFFADLLLRPGGVVAIHDTGWPSVYRACRFIETHKPYDRLSPPMGVEIKSLVGRLWRRAKQMMGGPRAMEEARQRRTQWYSLAAYRKRENYQVANDGYTPF